MKKTGIIRFVLPFFICLSWGVFSCSVTEQKQQGQKPNIILILADDIGFETIGCYGSASYKTPRIDKMAEEGVKFEQCYSQPLCSPSRVKIMTGKSNFRNYERWGYLNLNETTFAHILKSEGYSTCIAGKWQLRGDEFAPYKAGFDEYLLWNIVDTTSTYNERYKNPRLVENGVKKKFSNSEYGPKLFVNFITNFMERKKDKPFLIYYPMVLSHRPFVPTPQNGQDYKDFKVVPKGEPGGSRADTAYFKSEMAYVDKNVGEIIDKVNELGIAENTLILFTGDNGTGRGIFSTMKDGSKIPGMKGLTNEYGIHVPLVAYWKGKIKAGQVNDNLVDFADFLPTICDAAEIQLTETFVTDGISFLPQMLGDEFTPRDWLFCHYDPQKSGFEKRRFVHNADWKIYETGEIYHISVDPLEENVVSENELNEEQLQLISTFREVFPKMAFKEEPKKKKIKKSKNQDDDDDL